MVYCQNCGTLIAENTKFCRRNCGTQITKDTIFCPECGAEQVEEEKHA